MKNDIVKEEKVKLPEEFKRKWIEALRSGKYKQGKKALRPTEDTYCCLGVLETVCELSTNAYTYAEGTFGYSHKRQLIAMNDNGKSFLEIADYIEANL